MSTEQVSQNMDATTGVSVENETVAVNDGQDLQYKHTRNVTVPSTAPPEEREKQSPDVAALITKESRKAVEKLLKDAGITPEDNPEMQLREYKKWQDSQKTAFEKAQGDVQTLTKERDEAIAERNALNNRFIAISKGIPAEKVDIYLKVSEVYMEKAEGDIGKALDLALENLPLAQKNEPEPTVPHVVAPTQTEKPQEKKRQIPTIL